MAGKEIIFSEDARRALERGVNALAEAVKVTPWSQRTQCCFGEKIRRPDDYQ